MENLQNLLLEEIYLRYGSRTGTSLNAFIVKLGKLPSDLQFTIDLKTIIQNLENTGIVTWTANKKENPAFDPNKFKRELGTIDEKGNELTFDNIYVEVHLTHDKGLDYAGNIVNRELIRKSTIETNTSIKLLNLKTDDFYRVQKGLTWAIVISTIIYTIFSVLSFINGCNHENAAPYQQCKDKLYKTQPHTQSSYKQYPSDYDSSKILLNISKQKDTPALKQNPVDKKNKK